MSGLAAIIMAAGVGSRMKSSLPKVLHKVCQQPMLDYVLNECEGAGVKRAIVVAGPGGEVLAAVSGRAEVVVQNERKGTAHAVMQAAPALKDFGGTVLVLAGDMPLIRAETLKEAISEHERHKRAATLITSHVDEPKGYGRIIREGGALSHIVEERDATPEQKQIREINTSAYCFDSRALFSALPDIGNENNQGEYYLTDILGVLKSRALPVGAYTAGDANEFLGVNDRAQLSHVSAIMRRRINEAHARAGVSIIDLERAYISQGVKIEADAVIYPGTILEGDTFIGAGAVIGPDCRIENSRVAAGAAVEFSVLIDSVVGANTRVGPFAYLRPGAVIGEGCKIGDFVEIKNSVIGAGTKIPHLTYIGDSDVGGGVNVGCGSITVNYNGAKKQRTIIENGAFVGCNTNLIAPVTVGEDAYIAAGSTITEDVPRKTLAIARAKQTIKYDWADKRGAKK